MKNDAEVDERHREKAAVKYYRQKIGQMIESNPKVAKKAALILRKMIGEKKGSQK